MCNYLLLCGVFCFIINYVNLTIYTFKFNGNICKYKFKVFFFKVLLKQNLSAIVVRPVRIKLQVKFKLKPVLTYTRLKLNNHRVGSIASGNSSPARFMFVFLTMPIEKRQVDLKFVDEFYRCVCAICCYLYILIYINAVISFSVEEFDSIIIHCILL